MIICAEKERRREQQELEFVRCLSNAAFGIIATFQYAVYGHLIITASAFQGTGLVMCMSHASVI